ncbi:MAG: DUF4815 domain-containing protein [Gemmatimonadetes bacterium]|nr:DUF4815 domain-containing protein [Gemmatimonadota bacterium]
MHADITRDTFDPARHFSRVLMQQGRVPLDADLNEQSSILLHYLRTLAADLLGPYAGPRENLGFRVAYTPQNGGTLELAAGRYYVHGLLCEIERPQSVPVASAGPWPGGPDRVEAERQRAGQQPLQPPFLVYLEVWERLVTAYHQPLLRETALGGPDTAARAQVAWRIRVARLPGAERGWPLCEGAWASVSEQLARGAERGGLRVRAGGAQTDTLDPCVLPPDARYRGMENQLYRVEVHTAGQLGGGWDHLEQVENTDVEFRWPRPGGPGAPTFKWSRENGSVIFAIRSLQGVEVEVETLGLDARLDLAPGDWVEILDDLSDGPGVLARVADVDREGLRVTLEDTRGDYPEYDESHAGIHPLLRRWDQSDPVVVRGEGGGHAARGTLRDGAVQAVDGWIELESGISVRFETGRTYLPGDHWLIPARVATGDVEWPREEDGTGPATVPARRTERFYAPLAVVLGENDITDCRRCIGELTAVCGMQEAG